MGQLWDADDVTEEALDVIRSPLATANHDVVI